MELFLERLSRCWFATLALAVVAIALPKLFALENLPADWTLWWLGASAGLALLAALVWTWLSGRTPLDAAVEIDSRFGLRERVASSLLLTPTLAETPAGQALAADALRAIQRVEVRERFPVRIDRRGWLPLVSALAAFWLVTLADDRQAQSSIDPHIAAQSQQQLDAAAKKLRERLAERRKEAVAKGLKDAEGLFRELERQTKRLAESKKADRKEALVKLNDVARQLEERRARVGAAEQMRKQLDKMGEVTQGPADKMVSSMKQGDWQAAQQEAKRLQEQVEQGQLDEAGKKELSAQLQHLQDKLAEAAAAQQAAMDQLKQQIAQQQQAGNLQRAGELQQQLEQMQAAADQLKMLDQLGQLAGECKECMKQGDSQSASQALSEMQQQMSQMQQNLDEGQLLQAALDEVQQAKSAMSCSACQGQGCSTCQGGAKPGSALGQSRGSGSGKGKGQGSGEGKGQGSGIGKGSDPGVPPADQGEAQFVDRRVPQQPGPGAAVVAGEADGPNLRTQVAEAVREEMNAAHSGPADPQVLEQLPLSRREHAAEYFEAFGEGP